MESQALLVLLTWLVMATICGVIANSKGYSFGAWFFFGFLLWPAALLIIIARRSIQNDYLQMYDRRMPCPRCGESIPIHARVCRFCDHNLAAAKPVKSETREEPTAAPAPTAQPSGMKVFSANDWR